MNDERRKELEPYLEQLRFELEHIDWSEDSLLGTVAAISALREELGSIEVDTVIWFVAVASILQRPPSAEEAAELRVTPELREEMQALWDCGRKPSDLLH